MSALELIEKAGCEVGLIFEFDTEFAVLVLIFGVVEGVKLRFSEDGGKDAARWKEDEGGLELISEFIAFYCAL